ncbi:MAG: right-handed parallel beta-helix repeat-containing protein [bacterium]
MKGFTSILVAIFVLLIVSSFPCQAEETGVSACYKKNNGQLRILVGSDKCNPSETTITLNTAPAQEKTPIFLYVNGATGQDLPDYGLSTEKPFKTISFAMASVQFLRASAEFRATINVAAGTYNEALYIAGDNITLQGAGRDNTNIKGNGVDNVIDIIQAKGIELNGLLISNGKSGINAQFSYVTCTNIRIENNINNGLMAQDGSSVKIYDALVRYNNPSGILLANGATASINNSELSYQVKDGLQGIRNTSAVLRNVLLSNNSRYGVNAAYGSFFRLYDSEVKLNGVGIRAGGASTVNLYGGNTISDNTSGINLSDVSFLRSDYDSDRIINNYGTGITAYRNSSIWIINGHVDNNQGDGVALQDNSTGRFDSNVSIINNSGYGVHCVSGMANEIWAFLDGNTMGDTNCNQ